MKADSRIPLKERADFVSGVWGRGNHKYFAGYLQGRMRLGRDLGG